jgi:hypothetical protein
MEREKRTEWKHAPFCINKKNKTKQECGCVVR